MRPVSVEWGHAGAEGGRIVDLFTIAMSMAVALGLLGADAALTANTLGVQINVPATVSGNGINRDFAEDVFSTEIARMVQTPSLLSPPSVRSSSEKSLVSVIAKSLNLDELTFAVQQTIGLQPVRLSGTIIAGERTRFIMTASSSQTGPFTIDLRSDDGDVVALVRRAAQLTIERVEPYRAALFHFTQAADARSGDFSLAESIAERDLAQPLRADTLDRRALFINLLGIIALMRNDISEADRRFSELVEKHPKFAIGYLNLAFLRVHQDRYDEALQVVHRMLKPRPLTDVPQLRCAAYVTLGVAAWAKGRHREAEASFARAVREYWGTTAGYEYWARMLIETGRPEEGAQKRRLGVANLPYFENFPEAAMLYFELDPHDNAPLTRW